MTADGEVNPVRKDVGETLGDRSCFPLFVLALPDALERDDDRRRETRLGEDTRLCLLVLIGVAENGEKKLLAVEATRDRKPPKLNEANRSD
jgi:hypothetical protein